MAKKLDPEVDLEITIAGGVGKGKSTIAALISYYLKELGAFKVEVVDRVACEQDAVMYYAGRVGGLGNLVQQIFKVKPYIIRVVTRGLPRAR